MPYLSIGEVLGLLLEEFPDVTISKIRFLESQGLISPGAHAVGLSQVLRRRRRAAARASCASSARTTCRCVSSRTASSPARSTRPASSCDPRDPQRQQRRIDGNTPSSPPPHDDDAEPATGAAGAVRAHRRRTRSTPRATRRQRPPVTARAGTGAQRTGSARRVQNRWRRRPRCCPVCCSTRSELCSMVGMTANQLAQLDVVRRRWRPSRRPVPRPTTTTPLAIATTRQRFLDAGVDARHLRSWRRRRRA